MRARLGAGTLLAALLCPACEPVRPPPPRLFFAGLPVSGRLVDARRAGFDDCFNMDAVHMRCRRHGVTVNGAGPYEAAIDLVGGNGEGGFDQVILWHDRDNSAVFDLADALERAGWRYCYTGEGQRGDQAIYTRGNAPVRVSMDLSYYAKRRIRIIPASNRREPVCTPDHGAGPVPKGRGDEGARRR